MEKKMFVNKFQNLFFSGGGGGSRNFLHVAFLNLYQWSKLPNYAVEYIIMLLSAVFNLVIK